jgi:hypothetical protein
MGKQMNEEKIRQALEEHGSIAAAARALKVPRTTLRDRVHALQLEISKTKTTREQKSTDNIDTTETDDTLSIKYYGEEWLSKEAIIAKLDIDMAIWRLDKVDYRGWEVTGKQHKGQKIIDDHPVWSPQELWKTKNRYIALKFVRRAPKLIQGAISDLLARGSWPKTPTLKRKPAGECVLEVSLYDIHLGKYCWGKETGEPYDAEIASGLYAAAGVDLLEKTEHHNVNHVVIPVGQDFFQVDNWLSETAAGTRVDSVDDRFSKVFQVGVDSVRFLVEQCLKVGTVELIYVPGNHDRATSFYLCKVLEHLFESNKHVEVDTRTSEGHCDRKYRKFGRTLLGYTHGQTKESPKEDRLPMLMAQEKPEWWSQTTDRAWRLGHLHSKSTKTINLGYIWDGVRIERIPSLVATDSWHFRCGFVGARRAAEVWVWSYEQGLVSQHTSYADYLM